MMYISGRNFDQLKVFEMAPKICFYIKETFVISYVNIFAKCLSPYDAA